MNVRNALTGLERAQVVGRLAAVRKAHGRIARGERRVFDIDVRAGVELLVAEIQPAGGGQLDADLHLFDCTGEKCLLVRTGRSSRSRERVFVQNPQPGRWRVVLDAGSARTSQMACEYTDFYTVTNAGLVSVVDASIDRAAGAGWQVQIKPWLTGAVDSERSPAAVLFVQDAARTSQLGAETALEAFGCKTFPYCGTERRESVPLGLMLIDLAWAMVP